MYSEVSNAAGMLQSCFIDNKFLTGKSAIIFYDLNLFPGCFFGIKCFSMYFVSFLDVWT